MPDTIPAAAVQIPAAGIYQLDPAASTVTFATRHMFGLSPVKGTFRPVSGQITIADPVTSSTVSAMIDAASVATGNPQRDKDVSPECRTAVPFVWHRPYRCNFVGREIRTAPVCWSRAGLL